MNNIYKKLNLNSQSLIQKQKNFPLLTCVKSPTHKVKEKDTETNLEVEKDVNSLEIGKSYQLMRTELKDESSNTNTNSDLYLIVGSIDGLLFMNEDEIKEYFDLSSLSEDGYRLLDAPFYKTGIVFENKEYEEGKF